MSEASDDGGSLVQLPPVQKRSHGLRRRQGLERLADQRSLIVVSESVGRGEA